MALIATCIAVSLGELASAYPNSGGQYYWTARLAPKKYARFLSYSTGYLGWAGAVVVSGSVAVGLAQAVVGMIILANPNVLFYLESVPDIDWLAIVASFRRLSDYQLCCLLAQHRREDSSNAKQNLTLDILDIHVCHHRSSPCQSTTQAIRQIRLHRLRKLFRME